MTLSYLIWVVCLIDQGSSQSAPTGDKIVVSGWNNVTATFSVHSNGELMRGDDLDVEQGWSWLEVEDSTIWAITEDWSMSDVGGSVSRWVFGAEGNGLTMAEKLELGPGNTPTHLLVDKEHGLAFTANIGGGSWSVIRMEGDQLVEVQETFLLDTAGCNEASKPHQTVVSGDFAFVVDLGCDVVWTFTLGPGNIEMVQRNQLNNGTGPRHMSFHPQTNLAFIVAEYLNIVQIARINPDEGSLTVINQVDLSSVEGSNPKYGSEVLVGDTGEFLYVSSRSDDGGVLAVFSIDEDQEKISKVQEFQLNGTWPRHFAVQGDLMVVADQKGASVQVLHIDQVTGLLTTGEIYETPENPTFVGFKKEPSDPSTTTTDGSTTDVSNSATSHVPTIVSFVALFLLFIS
eukprot:GFUD01002557.1.p1 GENE.GFUD01002557.1~~GFUD01002557.1.p1  ORF type:complete len:401 (+),score=123.39 GFUD01002557.1:124-1326(+)